jgi:hypothetical protein
MFANIVSGNTVSATKVTMGNTSTVSDGALGNFALGYRDIPQVSTTADYTLALSDNSKHVFYTGTGNTIIVPTNADVAFPIGASILILNNGTGNLTLSTTGTTVYFAGTNASGDRVITPQGLASLLKVNTNVWYITGAGVV